MTSDDRPPADEPRVAGRTANDTTPVSPHPSPLSRARRVAAAAPPTPAPDDRPTIPGRGDDARPEADVAVGDAAPDSVGDNPILPDSAGGGPVPPDSAGGGAPTVRRKVPAVAGLRRHTRAQLNNPVSPPIAEPPGIAASAVPAGRRAGRNLPVAIGVGVGLGAVVLLSLFLYRPSFGYIVGIAVLYGCYELWRAFGSAGLRLTLFPLLVGSAAMLVAAWNRGPGGLVVAALLTVLAVWVWRLAEGAGGYLRDASASTFVVLYLPMLAGFALLLAHPHDGAARVLAFIVTVVCSDTGGYATGVLFGRHPLAPVVSKAKTWEGFAGSVVACSVAGVLFLTLTFHQAWWTGLVFGVALVVTATLGDLGESMIKRDLDLKDMGTLLPGHGGIMDRLDSLLPCAAVAYLLLALFAPR